MASIVVIFALVIFAAGAAAGAIFLVSLGIRREEMDFSLTRRAPNQVSQGARRVTGLWVRPPADDYYQAGRRHDSFV